MTDGPSNPQQEREIILAFKDEVDGLRAEIERQQHEIMRLQTANEYAFGPKGELASLNREIERLREEVEIWKDRYHAEHQDHEATMKAWDEERSGL